MSNDRINTLVLCALSLALITDAGETFESKVLQLLRDEPENIKCFSETLRDFTCFWEEEKKNSYLGQHSFTFIYQYQNENSSECAVSELRIQGPSGKRLFFCNIPKTQHFAPLQLRVFQGGRELYNRRLFIDHAVLLDPPANLTVVSTGKQGELNVSWLPPAVKYIDDSLMYEIRYVAQGSPMRKEIVKASTKFTLRSLQASSKYKVLVRVKPDGITYDGYWSAWSDPEFGTTTPSDPLIVVLVLIISLILILLSLTMLLSHHKFLLKKLWPEIPSPEHKFPGLFTIYKGDFQEWLGHCNGSRWPVYMYTEELPSSLEVLSEVSQPPMTSHTSTQRPETTHRAADFLREEPQAIEGADNQLETGLIVQWQEPPHSHWLMEQLRTFQEHPEVLSRSSLLESQDTYVTLNQNSQRGRGEVQRDDSFEESLPLQVLFAIKESSLMAASDSDIGSLPQCSGSGRLSSQSSLEYPNHTWPPKGPGYTYMAVADSGVSMDYSPMSFSRITDMGNGTIYANEYKNDIPGHKRPLIGY
ncbi:erythropoietin receptor [Ictalurus furcatus]|uniref:erythropoietin receptor n=1 Tax=Ictalurus furcatus TaxID=66913 RepID=UPI00235004CE|nr:erythropoietin receptor [Ictalurus furcatus]